MTTETWEIWEEEKVDLVFGHMIVSQIQSGSLKWPGDNLVRQVGFAQGSPVVECRGQ